MDKHIAKLILTAEKIDSLQREMQVIKEDITQYAWDKTKEKCPDLIDKPQEEILKNEIKDEDKRFSEQHPTLIYRLYMLMEQDDKFSEEEKESFKTERKKILQGLFDSVKIRLLKINQNLK